MTLAPKYPNLTLTGTVLDLHDDVKNRPSIDMVPVADAPAGAETVQVAGETLALVPAEKPNFAAGDIAIYKSLDAGGRAAVRGRNSNYGYSGYFKASVFDGKGWRNLELRGFLPEPARNYATQGESGAVRKRLVEAVGALAGKELVYGVRKYGMPGMKPPAPVNADSDDLDGDDSVQAPRTQTSELPTDKEQDLNRRRANAEAEAAAIRGMIKVRAVPKSS